MSDIDRRSVTVALSTVLEAASFPVPSLDRSTGSEAPPDTPPVSR